jgi:hypothetical protein
MDGKKLVLLGILVIAAGAAFVYFDPLDMNLLGMNKAAVVAKPAVPHVVPKAAAPAQPKAPMAVHSPAAPPVPAATSSVAVPKIATAAMPAKPPVAAAPAPAVPAASNAVAEAQIPLPPMKLSEQTKTASKPVADKPPRPKNLDLRHCLDLETDAAIAKCAGE